ncbi:MAG TPA: hypothetical protein DET40_10905 [Lentisphaeria bacterium]|nr:MAG: hypothetical protein A2X45_11430 [Lentisphaerae bacterium GWF2_50_93]HCE44046.1 hypothetical protein [Lentisphaeria bacterium]
MNRLPLKCLALAGLLGLTACVNVSAGNLVQNGSFEPLSGWVIVGDKSSASFDSASQSICITGAEKPASVRQLDLAVRAGRKYQLSCKMKAEACEGKEYGLSVINSGWTWAAGFLKPEGANSDWVDLKGEIIPLQSNNGKYEMIFRGPAKGRIYVKEIALVPVGGDSAEAVQPLNVRANCFSKDNLVMNGDFSVGEVFPDAWIAYAYDCGLVYDRKGGKDGMPALGVRQHATSVRQPGVILVPGETYRMSGFLKTKGFKGPDGKVPRGGVVVITDGWKAEVGILADSPDTGWKYFEKVFTAPPTVGNTYSILFYTTENSGELWACDVKLQARRQSLSPFEASEFQRIYPINPRTDAIPADAPLLTLGFPYVQKGEEQNYECQVSAKDFDKSFPLKDGQVQADLKGLPEGEYKLDTAIVNKHTGQAISKTQIQVKIIAPLKMDLSNVKPLNSMVSELLSTELALDPAASSECVFANPRDGWVFVAATPAAATDGVSVSLTGDKKGTPAVQADGSALPVEAMRWLPAGEQKVSISAKQLTKVKLVVRSIPELLYDAPNYSPYKFDSKAAGNYDWAFIEKYVLPCTTTFSRGSLKPDELAKAKSRGMRWLSNIPVAVTPLGMEDKLDADEIAAAYAKDPGYTDPKFDGATADEFWFSGTSPVVHATYARAIEKLYQKIPQDKSYYAWITCGVPYSKMIFGDFMSQIANHNGLLLFEAYPEPAADELLTKTLLEDFIVNSLKVCKQVFPGVQKSMGYMIGTHSMPLDINQFSIPSVDHKYLLDLTVNAIANSPEFQGLGGLGIYTSGHADEETLRWTARLIRHYGVEGSKEMLSRKFGYTYIPGIISNCDFEKGSESWTCMPAEPDSIKPDSFKKYGVSQARWGLNAIQSGLGDSFMVMRRSNKAPNKVSQSMKGLVPGNLYAVQFLVADYAGIKAPGAKAAKYAFSANIEGSHIIPEKSYVLIGTNGIALGKGKYFGNIHRLVFRAGSASATLSLSDWTSDKEAGGPAGQELIVNFVHAAPYFEE